MTGASVTTHHSALRSSLMMDPNMVVPVENIPVTNMLSSKMMGGA